MEKIQVEITGSISGFQKEGETKRDAEYRIILEAEQRINKAMDIRIHLWEKECKRQ